MTTKENKLPHSEEQIIKILRKNYSIITSEIEKVIDEILLNKEGREIIINEITKRSNLNNSNTQIIDGLMYQKIIEIDDQQVIKTLIQKLPNGAINLTKCKYTNYQKLQNLLINKKFKEADKLTQRCLCEIVELNTKSKKSWLYFTDIQFVPKNDLFILDLLWKIYSKGKFGFSVQKKIWINNNKKWDKLWEKIQWLKEGVMKRYPQEFMWTIDAPEGHLPLFNQLRGTQALYYLFNNIEW
uniref:GUN4-like domain-containing protein n=1 Tax=Symphyocladiella dendroidea TaxID=2506487 RepID=A0A1Z1M726_9FLOR|nr:hypothetical protein [Symphyocladiella dendroidea]ARW61789.1 hypothetical protein [Symphyocladiella dendroidea]